MILNVDVGHRINAACIGMDEEVSARLNGRCFVRHTVFAIEEANINMKEKRLCPDSSCKKFGN